MSYISQSYSPTLTVTSLGLEGNPSPVNVRGCPPITDMASWSTCVTIKVELMTGRSPLLMTKITQVYINKMLTTRIRYKDKITSGMFIYGRLI